VVFFGDEMNRPAYGYAGIQYDGELTAHQGEGLGLDLAAADLHIEKPFLVLLNFRQLCDDVVVLLYSVGGVHLIEGLDNAVDLLSALADSLIFELFQKASPPENNICAIFPPVSHPRSEWETQLLTLRFSLRNPRYGRSKLPCPS
jgi:hypothetical protein